MQISHSPLENSRCRCYSNGFIQQSKKPKSEWISMMAARNQKRNDSQIDASHRWDFKDCISVWKQIHSISINSFWIFYKWDNLPSEMVSIQFTLLIPFETVSHTTHFITRPINILRRNSCCIYVCVRVCSPYMHVFTYMWV